METIENVDLIQALLSCAHESENAVSACSREKEDVKVRRCMELNKDCAEICLQAARLLGRFSKMSNSFLSVCAKACKMSASLNSKIKIPECNSAYENCMKCLNLIRIRQSKYSKLAVV